MKSTKGEDLAVSSCTSPADQDVYSHHRHYEVISFVADYSSGLPKDKRDSMSRPVLRLQVKQETLERQGIKPNPGNIHMVSKGTLRTLARESGICAGN